MWRSWKSSEQSGHAVSAQILRSVSHLMISALHLYTHCGCLRKKNHINVIFQVKLASHTHVFVCFVEFISSYFVYCHNHTKYVFAAHEGGSQHVFSGVSCLLVHKVTEPGILRYKYREVLYSFMFNTAVSWQIGFK